MRTLFVLGIPLAACTNNAPQYVQCAPMGAAPADSCSFEAGVDDGTGNTAGAGQLHLPVLPEAEWAASDIAKRRELQAEIDRTNPGVVVPLVRLEHYDISVEWIVRNLEPSMGTFRVDLNGANELAAYDNSMIMRADDEDPPPPPLAGDIPTTIGPMGTPEGTVSGVFREDQLREAAIDLDQISRANVNPFAAMLTINKNDDEFSERTPTVYDPTTGDTTGGEPTGVLIPEAAWRQLVRVDINFRPDRHMEIEFAVRLRVHRPVIHEEGLSAPAGEITVYDPPYYVATIP
jgi:hypothetical protein